MGCVAVAVTGMQADNTRVRNKIISNVRLGMGTPLMDWYNYTGSNSIISSGKPFHE
jgi:hypothetical protein